ncbi:MAG: flagellar basal body rod protein FlgB [Pseudomonadota bacterium]
MSLGGFLDDALGVHAQALAFRGARSRVLASNLANADTPGYLARDLSFDAALSGANATLSTVSTHSAHLGTGERTLSTGPALYRYPHQPTLDGNTVETEVEQAKFSRNAVEYQASLTFLNGRINAIRDALTGGAGR